MRDSLLSFLFPAVSLEDTFTGDLLVCFVDKEQPVGRGLHRVAHRVRLDEVQGNNQVRDLPQHTDQGNLGAAVAHPGLLGPYVDNRNQQLLGRGTAVDVVLPAGRLENLAANREGDKLGIVAAQDLPHLEMGDALLLNRRLCHHEAAIHRGALADDATNLV